MNRPWFAGSDRNTDFCRSAMASVANPMAQITMPMIPITPIDSRRPEVMAASAAPAVKVIHRPWRVQVIRNWAQSCFISSKRRSRPAARTRWNRNHPRRMAQTSTITARITVRASRSSARITVRMAMPW